MVEKSALVGSGAQNRPNGSNARQARTSACTWAWFTGKATASGKARWRELS